MASTLMKTVYGRHSEIKVYKSETLLSLKYEVYVGSSCYSSHKTLGGAVETAEKLARTR